jgi:hypothetical protein
LPRNTGRIALAIAAAIVAAGCASTERLSLHHRRAPGALGRIVVLPVAVPQDADDLPEGEGKTLASLYATELLQTYDILEFERFVRELEERSIALDSVLVNGIGEELRRELEIDGVLLSEVYSWQPGVPGILFLSKEGRIGFLARLIDLSSGSVIWSVNRVGKASPGEPLSVAMGRLFADLVSEMPHNLIPY